MNTAKQAALRIRQGIQCPECWGVSIRPRREFAHGDRVIGFQCQECGCQWTINNPVVSKNYR